jgi:D-3-phosphoglycerate dehydrogenase / 2-oxoglutarate reductase
MLALVSSNLSAPTKALLERERAWELRQVPSIREALETMPAATREQVRAIFVEAEPIGEAILSKLENLEMIGCLRSEPVNIDIEAASDHGVAVVHTPGRNAEAVADFTLGLCLAMLRNIAVSHHAILSGELTTTKPVDGAQRAKGDVIWRPDDPTAPIPYVLYKGHQLSKLVVAVVGFGAVGRAVARRFDGLVGEICIVDPAVSKESIEELGFVATSLPEALSRADVVTIHARSATQLMGRAEIEQMKPGSYLINTARATVLDYDALSAALTSGKLGGAALDVFPDEPLSSTDPILGVPHLTLTPHLAGAAYEVVDVMWEIIVRGIAGLYDPDTDWSTIAVRNADIREVWEKRFGRV